MYIWLETIFGTVQKWSLRPLLDSPKGGLYIGILLYVVNLYFFDGIRCTFLYTIPVLQGRQLLWLFFFFFFLVCWIPVAALELKEFAPVQCKKSTVDIGGKNFYLTFVSSASPCWHLFFIKSIHCRMTVRSHPVKVDIYNIIKNQKIILQLVLDFR